jgi:NADPH:quinone reductase-like Zn-dependent oxidoreductase
MPANTTSAATLPATMRALLVPAAGSAFEEVQLPTPTPAAGQVLVKIAASGVNPLDTKIRAGKAAHAHQPLPAVLGMDLAGTVVAVGEGVTDFKPGDEVYGMAGGIGGLQGTLAEYIAADARLLAPKPRNLSMREAAALPLAAITAWEGLVDRAHVKAGDTVLVHGGAGGVGHIAVQLACAFGAQVFTTVSAEQFATVQAYGATPIDYRASTVEQYVAEHTEGGKGFDIVYDTVGGATLDASFTAARKYGGHVLSILGWGTHSLAPLSFRAATYSGVFTLMPMLTGEGWEAHGRILREVGRLVEAGKIAPMVEGRQFALDTGSVLDAYQVIELGQARGKLVVSFSI